MNALQAFLQDLDDTAALNQLTAAGIISDNCITTADVANTDAEQAVQWLKKNSP